MKKTPTCFLLNLFECFQSFRYARRISEITVNDRLSAAALISTTGKTERGMQRELRVGQEKGQISTPRTVV